MALGMAVMGLSFLVPPAVAGLVAAAGDGLAGTVIRVAPVVAAAVLLALGVTAVQPFVNEAIGRFAGNRLTGTYFGAFYLASGVFTVVGTSVTGAVLDRSGGSLTWPPAVLCAAAGLLSALAVLRLHRRRVLPGPGEPTAEPAVDDTAAKDGAADVR